MLARGHVVPHRISTAWKFYLNHATNYSSMIRRVLSYLGPIVPVRASWTAIENRENEPIYESCEVKRAGADCVSREPLHIPLAVGVGRSGPSQTPPTAPVVHPRHTSPEPEAEGGPPTATSYHERDGRRDS